MLMTWYLSGSNPRKQQDPTFRKTLYRYFHRSSLIANLESLILEFLNPLSRIPKSPTPKPTRVDLPRNRCPIVLVGFEEVAYEPEKSVDDRAQRRIRARIGDLSLEVSMSRITVRYCPY
jgi:hypothetical protein